MGNWMHLGTAEAATECKMVEINGQSFAAEIAKDARAFQLCVTYAQNYVTWLNSLPGRLLTDVLLKEDYPNAVVPMLGEDEEVGGGGGRGSLIKIGSVSHSSVKRNGPGRIRHTVRRSVTAVLARRGSTTNETDEQSSYSGFSAAMGRFFHKRRASADELT